MKHCRKPALLLGFALFLFVGCAANRDADPSAPVALASSAASAYAQMSVEAQAPCSALKLGEAVSQTRYFRVTEPGLAGTAAYGLGQGPWTIEVTEEEFLAGTAAMKRSDSPAKVKSSDTWCKLLVRITKGTDADETDAGEADGRQYTVSVFLNVYHQGLPELKPGTFSIAASVNPNLSPISGSESCYVIYQPNGEMHFTRAPHKYPRYGFDFSVPSSTYYNYTAGMSFLAEPNNSALTLVDACGYAGYWDEEHKTDGV